MLIFWRIRYLDRVDKQFKNRDLFLDTATLPPAKRAAVELVAESRSSGNDREVLTFRSLFTEGSWADWGEERRNASGQTWACPLYTYDAADEKRGVDLGAIRNCRKK